MEVKSIYDLFVDILCFGKLPHKISTNPNIVTYGIGVVNTFTQMEIILRDCKILISNTLNTETEQIFHVFSARISNDILITFKPKTIIFDPKLDRIKVEGEIRKIQKELCENFIQYKLHHILYKIRIIKKLY